MNSKKIFIFTLLLIFSTFAQAEEKKCYVGDKEVPCPNSNQVQLDTEAQERREDSIILDANEKYNAASEAQEWRGDLDILPDNPNKYEQRDMLFILPFILILVSFAVLALFKIKIFGKTLKDYIWPIKYYMLVSVLVVFSQYLIIGLPLPYKHIVIGISLPSILFQYSFILRLTQALWALMVALSVVKLVKEYNFNIKNILFLGVLYSFIIHGLKVSIRHFFYDRPIYYILDRFIYGSILVMVVVLIGPIIIYLKKKGVKL